MARTLRSIWVILVYIFIILIPVQFYLAGHGAMEGAYSADKKIVGMYTAWDPHVAVGTIMALVAILILLLSFGAKLPRPLFRMSIALFVFMLIQYILPLLYDSASTRWIAALHAVNALIVTGIAIGLAMTSRPYSPIARFRTAEAEPAGSAAPIG